MVPARRGADQRERAPPAQPERLGARCQWLPALSIQAKPIAAQCSKCPRPAVYGLFAWKPGASDIDMNKPTVIVCGRHKYLVKLCTKGGPLLRWARLAT